MGTLQPGKYDEMGKAHLKKALQDMYLDTEGTHEEMIARLEEAIADGDEMPEISPEEAAEITAETAAKAAALAHLNEVDGGKYADMKAPMLREELKKRGLSEEGKKAVLIERLATALEAEGPKKKGLSKKELKKYKKMSKSHLKKALKKQKLSTDGSRDELITRLVEAINAGNAEVPEIDEAEAAEMAAENAAKEAALAHLTASKAEFAEMKAPQLREELKKRGLSEAGKKAELMERLATAVDEEVAAGGPAAAPAPRELSKKERT